MKNQVAVKQGEAKTLTLTVKDLVTGQARNLTGATLFLGCKNNKDDAAYVFSKADGVFVKTDQTIGIVLVPLSATDTNQPPGVYVMELKLTFGGDVFKTEDLFLNIEEAMGAVA